MPGWALAYDGSLATSFRTEIPELAMYHFSAFAFVCIVLTKSKARSGLPALEGIAQVQPPDMLTLPGAWPCWVGMYARPNSLDHCGHSCPLPFNQAWGNQDPSRAMPNLPLGRSSPATMVWILGSRAVETSGPSFSWNTVCTNDSASLNPWLEAIHFFDALSYSGSDVPSPVP